ncbi:LytTR family DNA-binding domain-containing protein [Comamonas sp. JC664]|uniref:LytR/AlgR family response regulator transcription factor n=1 Tax=Comamonas sp. JC664 TaxID=2801917 RepID=UPI00174B7CAB|nr:LytTR family DNA-binding domain-containing protein [Comamonas sp. JC664]MBL0696953.1 response regulator transcription factor [Comamonas sp. JC664]GHG81644.1 DNA-binding response regulator [Comamonas sp. KCTC 72670]
MTRFRVLVADDEAPARAKVKRLLADDARFVLEGEASDGTETLNRVVALRPDLLVLDVQMPGLTGFEVLEALGPEHCPAVIFSTAYDAFAVAAFEAQAVDYLLKPYDAERFGRALERAYTVLQSGLPETARLQALLSDLGRAEPRRPLERLVVKVGEAFVPLPLADVWRLSSEDKYVRLYTAQGEHLVRQTLRGLEERLDPTRFVRVHRGDIVNLDAVARLEPWTHGDGILVLEDGSSVVLSRTWREAFLQRWGLEG